MCALRLSHSSALRTQWVEMLRVTKTANYPAGAAAGYCFLLVSLPAMPQAFVSYEFLSSSSGNTSFSHTSLHPILTKLGHSDQYLNHYSGTNNDGVRGHDGVTGVKN